MAEGQWVSGNNVLEVVDRYTLSIQVLVYLLPGRRFSKRMGCSTPDSPYWTSGPVPMHSVSWMTLMVSLALLFN